MKQLVFHIERRHIRGARRDCVHSCPAARALTERFQIICNVGTSVWSDTFVCSLGYISKRLERDIIRYDKGGRAPRGTYRLHLTEQGAAALKVNRAA